MKISILIAAHSSAIQVRESLESVRSQKHENWEVIIASGADAGPTETLVRDFAALTNMPALHHAFPVGAPATFVRNRLLDLATGDPVAFLEPGDVWQPHHLANALRVLGNDADLAVSDVRPAEKPGSRVTNEPIRIAQLVANPVRTLFVRDIPLSLSSLVFRRGSAARIGGFDERFHAVAVRDFWLRCAIQHMRFVATQRATCSCLLRPTPTRDELISAAEDAVAFYEKHRDLAAVPAAMRRRLLAASLVNCGKLLRATDTTRAARCFLRAWSLQPVHVQTLGQFALTGWRSPQPPTGEPRRRPNPLGSGHGHS